MELRIVFAKLVGDATCLVLVPAVLAANHGSRIPHAFGIGGASTLSGVAVLALTFASGVGLSLDTNSGFTPSTEVADGVTKGVDAEVEPGHVGDVEVDVDGVMNTT